MNVYVNPGNDLFAAARKDPIFVDISDLIGFTNTLINTPGKKLCVTRPRRFGKTLALYMLSAYYSRGCDSSDLFRELEIAEDPSFPLHLNRHNVILLDIQFMYWLFLREGKQKEERLAGMSKSR